MTETPTSMVDGSKTYPAVVKCKVYWTGSIKAPINISSIKNFHVFFLLNESKITDSIFAFSREHSIVEPKIQARVHVKTTRDPIEDEIDYWIKYVKDKTTREKEKKKK